VEDREDVEREKERLYAPLYAEKEGSMTWKELNMAISKAMQNYCGGIKCDALLEEGLDLLKAFEKESVPRLSADNPHDLMRIHEVLDILTVAQIVLHASLARKSSSEPLCFKRSDYPEVDPASDRRHLALHWDGETAVVRSVPLDFFGDLQIEYEKRNQDYMENEAVCKYTLESPQHVFVDKKVQDIEKQFGNADMEGKREVAEDGK
jgi:succinate dehydrogenase/fumarate reductase flavoprotein subunit